MFNCDTVKENDSFDPDIWAVDKTKNSSGFPTTNRWLPPKPVYYRALNIATLFSLRLQCT
jgi:hypothetical protein